MSIIIFLIPFYDLLILINSKIQNGEGYSSYTSSFLSGSTEGHLPQILLLWYLPIFLMIIVSSNYIEEKSKKYDYIIISKIGKKQYILNKFSESFFVSSIIIFVTLLMNFIMCLIFFNTEINSKGFMETNWPENTLYSLEQTNPYITYIIFLLVVSLIAGLYSMVCVGISLVFPDKKIVYPLTFLVWFVQVLIQNGSLMDIFQPYTEYNFEHVLTILTRTILVAGIIIFITYFYAVKKDEV